MDRAMDREDELSKEPALVRKSENVPEQSNRFVPKTVPGPEKVRRMEKNNSNKSWITRATARARARLRNKIFSGCFAKGGGFSAPLFFGGGFPAENKRFFRFNSGPDLYNLGVERSVIGNPKETMQKKRIDRKSGQVMLEYLVVLAVSISLLSMCAVLLYAFRTYGSRVLSLIASC
jgi:hypothetical protein